MDWEAIALEEYKSLRQESLGAIEQMQRTIQLGLVAIGVITAFGVNANRFSAPVQAALVVSAPAFAALVVVISLDELRRAVEAGVHVAGIERRLAERFALQPAPLTWETGLQQRHAQGQGLYWSRHWTTSAALFAATAPVVVLALVALAQHHEWPWPVGSGLAAALVIVLAWRYQRWAHAEMSRVRGQGAGRDSMVPGRPASAHDAR